MKGGQNAKKSREASAPRKQASTGSPDDPVEVARQLAAIVETHSLSELRLQTGGLRITVRRGDTTQAPSGGLVTSLLHAPPPSSGTAAHARPHVEPSGGAATQASPTAEPEHHVVTSPFVGTFYRSPTPDADPYVAEGQRVEKGQVLCIVEAMKLMNEIEADQSGIISAVLVQNSQPVEYGQPLFRISPP